MGLTALILCFLSLDGFAQNNSDIVITHQETVDRAQIGLEKNRVRDQALLNALLQASQSMVPAQAYKANQALMEALLSRNVQNFVKDYRYIDQGFRGQSYRVELEVEPQWFLLKNKLTEWGIIPYKATPTLVIEPVEVGSSVKGTPSSQYWTQQLVGHLQSLGFSAQAIDSNQTAKNFAYQISMKLVRLNGQEAEAVFSWGDAKGQQRFQKTWSGSRPSQESLLAGMFAVFVVEHTMPKWFAQKGDQTQYFLILEGIKQYQDLQALKQSLEQQKNLVRSFQDYSYRADSVTLELRLASSLEALMQWLSAQQIGTKQLSIVDRENRTLRLRLQ